MEPNSLCTADHHHHWLIDEASGAHSLGRCKYCHANREFRNWLLELDFVGGREAQAPDAAVSYGARTTPQW